GGDHPLRRHLHHLDAQRVGQTAPGQRRAARDELRGVVQDSAALRRSKYFRLNSASSSSANSSSAISAISSASRHAVFNASSSPSIARRSMSSFAAISRANRSTLGSS